MKSTLSILSAVALLQVSAFAQPTINIGDATPAIGSSATIAEGSYSDPGAAGANQTWDLTGMIPEMVNTITFLTPDGLPESGSFPGATHVASVTLEQDIDSYDYYAIVNNTIEELGYYSTNPDADILFVYTNPRTHLVFPVNYNNTFNDTFETIFENEIESGEGTVTMVSTENGSISAVVDGYGTLSTPTGTYDDVIRVRYDLEVTTNVTIDGEESFSSDRTEEWYYFYSSEIPVALATLNTTTLYFMGEVIDESTSGSFFMDMGVGLEDGEPLFTNVQLFPVPAQTHIVLQLNSKDITQTDFTLLSTSGKIVHQWIQQSVQPGTNHVRLDLPELANGAYFLQMSSSERRHTERVFIGN